MFTNNGLLILSVLVIMFTSLVGAHFGVGGISSYTGGVSMSQPTGIAGAFDMIGDGIAFLWNAVTFQLEDVPALFNILIFTPIAYIMVYLVMKWIRGTE
ncbi:hypothetical protein [Dehalococcoides mccartyi]|uniref:hypothetical protein n=1 Tax=Dehalococcoides mccartyi TaxID=61435 RepID=UPI0003C811A6|nr:hypothetical protein [Dehalococcoides mccartyi]AHB12893.1 putative membrane protein [Dehalococcoides mccartyi GY50]